MRRDAARAESSERRVLVFSYGDESIGCGDGRGSDDAVDEDGVAASASGEGWGFASLVGGGDDEGGGDEGGGDGVGEGDGGGGLEGETGDDELDAPVESDPAELDASVAFDVSVPTS